MSEDGSTAGTDGKCGQSPLESAQAEQPTPAIGVFWRPFQSVSPPDRFPQRPTGELLALVRSADACDLADQPGFF